MNPKAKEKPAEKKARTRKLADEMILHLDGCRVLNFFYADKGTPPPPPRTTLYVVR